MKGIKNFFCASPASTAIVSGHRERRRDGTVPRRKTSTVLSSSSSHMLESPKSISSVSSVDSEHAVLCSRSPPDQVVELEVAIDCKACERKVRKHISKMEGVKSFSIEMETRKVTIRGDVSPLGVLESISKVKRAQFWSS